MEGKNLVIVESPGKVKTIQKYLGGDYLVKASIGHIRDLQEKKLSVDVEHGFQPEYVVPADKKKVVSDLKKLAAAAQTVWLASDEDREGEAISWHLSETLGLDPAKTRRIVFHEITKPAILDAIQHPRDIDRNLVDAQQARRVLDRLVLPRPVADDPAQALRRPRAERRPAPGRGPGEGDHGFPQHSLL